MDLTLDLEIVQKQRDEGHLIIDILVFDRRDTDNDFAWDEENSATTDHHWPVIDEFLSKLRLFKHVLISAHVHTEKAELMRVFPASTHRAILRGEQLFDGLNVVSEIGSLRSVWDCR